MDGVFLYSLILIIPVLVFLIVKSRIGKTERVKYGDFEGRIQKYSLRIQMDPKDTMAYYERGLAYIKSNNKSAALEDLKMAAVLGHDKAYEIIEKHNLGKLNQQHLSRGNMNLTEDFDVVKSIEYQGALEDYNKVLKSNPENSVAYFMRADVKEVYNDHNGAIDDLTNALKYNNKYPEALYKRGAIKIKLNDYKGAKFDLEASLSLGFFRAKSLLKKIENRNFSETV